MIRRARYRAAFLLAMTSVLFVVIEARVPHDDISPISRRYIRESLRKAEVS